jgi:O-antigen ligase
VTLVSGFGWDVYDTRFVYATHNYYLDLWFNLGLIGLLAFVAILYQAVKTARAAADLASEQMRPYMIAMVFGMLGLAVNILFTNLGKPWPYIWIYMGLTLSAAAKIIADTTQRRAEEPVLGVVSPAVRGAR